MSANNRRVLVAMSGGVDSSVAAALLLDAGHEVVGATLKLWGGKTDSGCCSVADVDDARRVADQLGIVHHVFNFANLFEDAVVGPYVSDHLVGRTPNPCVECNRHIKFGALLERAGRLGFDFLATGHHARVVSRHEGLRLCRGKDQQKDQSYVLAMLGSSDLAKLKFPVGELTKREVRAHAERLGLRTAAKPDSQDVCFIHSAAGRRGFLSARAPLNPGDLVDSSTSKIVGRVPEVELVTLGQRRGLGVSGDGTRRYALSVDVKGRRVVVGGLDDAVTSDVRLEAHTWVDRELERGERALAQTSAHGRSALCTWDGDVVRFDEPQRLVAPGQTVAFYDPDSPDVVLGAAIAA